jgi:hypothetical protein
MSERDEIESPKQSHSWSVSAVLAALFGSVLLSIFLYSIAHVVSAVAGMVGAAWLLTKSEEVNGKWRNVAFYYSVFGFAINMLLIGGAVMIALCAPAWILAQLGLINLR